MSDLKNLILATLTSQTEEANALATRIAAATTDRTKMVHEILTDENATDDYVVTYQQWEEKALAKIEEERAKVVAKITAEKFADVDEATVEALKTEYKGKVDAVKAARKYAEVAIPDLTEEDLKAVPDLKTLRGGTAGKGGTGGKRPRVNAISFRDSASGPWTEASVERDDAKNPGAKVKVTNFTVLSGALKDAYGAKVEVKDLQAAAFEAAGTDDLNTLDGKVFDFAISVGEGDNAKNVYVKVQPKAADAE